MSRAVGLRRARMRRTWAALADELDGDHASVERFALSYAERLEARVERVGRSASAGDTADARAALLSVRCTSAMLGADLVETSATHALALLGTDGPAAVVREGPLLRAAAEHTLGDVAAVLLTWRDGSAQPTWSNR